MDTSLDFQYQNSRLFRPDDFVHSHFVDEINHFSNSSDFDWRNFFNEDAKDNMSSKVETLTTNNGETFTRGTYNGISILIRDKDGYINASKLGNNWKPSRHFIQSERFKQICQYWTKRNQSKSPQYTLNEAPNGYRGVYIHPDLIHFVAEWVDIEYAFIVSDIMNSINEKLHKELEKQHLQDVVEIAKPIFKEIAKSITNNINNDLVNKQCWGYRDSAYDLDPWERDDLNRDINEYNDLKSQLAKARAKVEKWSTFIPTYHPDFEY